MSLSAETGGLVEEPFSAFARSREVRVDGYPSALSEFEVMRRARATMKPGYSLLDFNCEHFVRHAHGVPPQSPQVQGWAFLGTLGILLAFGLKR